MELENKTKPAITPGLIFGLLITAAGVVLLLDRAGFVNARDFFRFWPMVLVIIGLGNLFQARASAMRLWGGLLVVTGLALQLSQFGYLSLRFRDVWPVFLIAVGLYMAWGAVRRKSRAPEPGQDVAVLNHWAMFGGGEIRSNSPDFRGGEVLAIFGGYEIDLRNAGIAGDQITIDATAIFGGVEIKVPTNWTVTSEGLALFGGYEDKTSTQGAEGLQSAKRLIVKGLALFGGVEVKN